MLILVYVGKCRRDTSIVWIRGYIRGSVDKVSSAKTITLFVRYKTVCVGISRNRYVMSVFESISPSLIQKGYSMVYSE